MSDKIELKALKASIDNLTSTIGELIEVLLEGDDAFGGQDEQNPIEDSKQESYMFGAENEPTYLSGEDIFNAIQEFRNALQAEAASQTPKTTQSNGKGPRIVVIRT